MKRIKRLVLKAVPYHVSEGLQTKVAHSFWQQFGNLVSRDGANLPEFQEDPVSKKTLVTIAAQNCRLVHNDEKNILMKSCLKY